MKKIITVFMCLIMLSVSFLPVAGAQPLSEGTVIVIPENSDGKIQYAAETLKNGIEEVTGTVINIVSDTEANGAYRILVGNTSLSQTDTEGLADGSYFIKSGENCIEINGAGNRGNIYGVYRFLEEFAGYHCYSEKTGYKSYTGKLDIPEDADIEYTPFFEYTETDWHSPSNDIYSLANGLNGNDYRDLSPEQGGTVDYISNFCHTLTSQFCSKDVYFEEHPEYFALSYGERVPDQLCLSNGDVYDIVLSEVFALLEEKHDPEAALQIISLTQADNGNYCTCENCKAIDEANGSQSGSVITFVNKIARAVKEAGYDNIAIDTFAYQYTRQAPAEVIPEPNVIVRLCTIECCFTHSLDDATCEDNVELMQDLADWNEICDHIYVWDYTTNYAQTAGIFPDFPVIQKNMQTFYEHGVKGVYEEGAYYVDSCDTEFGELRAYLLSRLMQNPYCDIETETDNFLSAFYGEGGDEIGQVLDILNANAVKQHVKIYSLISSTFSLSKAEAKEIDSLWEKAKTETADDEFALANITRSELSWRYVKSSLSLCEFSGLFGKAEANRQLYSDLLAAGVTTFDEGFDDGIEVPSSYAFIPAENWQNNDFFKTFIYVADWTVYALALVFALLLVIRAIRYKKYIYCVQLPLFAAFTAVAMWSRNIFLEWRHIALYVATLVIAFAVTVFASYLSVRLTVGKTVKKILLTFLYTLLFFVLYEGPITVINVIMFHGGANDFSLSISYFLTSLFILALLIRTFRILKVASRKKVPVTE